LDLLGGLARTGDALTGERRANPLDLDFHQQVLEMSGNPNLVGAGREVSVQFQLARARSWQVPGRAGEAYDEHWAIYEAIRLRDADVAEAAMREHLAHSQRSIEQLFSEGQTAPAAGCLGQEGVS
jgi:DNA-binding FadR family transcriptional regulator